LIDGDFFIGASVASTLTKLALRYGNMVKPQERNRFDAEVMLIMAGIIHLGKSGESKQTRNVT
jgi:coatomer subunit beta